MTVMFWTAGIFFGAAALFRLRLHRIIAALAALAILARMLHHG
jgi:hypothetical protein